MIESREGHLFWDPRLQVNPLYYHQNQRLASVRLR